MYELLFSNRYFQQLLYFVAGDEFLKIAGVRIWEKSDCKKKTEKDISVDRIRKALLPPCLRSSTIGDALPLALSPPCSGVSDCPSITDVKYRLLAQWNQVSTVIASLFYQHKQLQYFLRSLIYQHYENDTMGSKNILLLANGEHSKKTQKKSKERKKNKETIKWIRAQYSKFNNSTTCLKHFWIDLVDWKLYANIT